MWDAAFMIGVYCFANWKRHMLVPCYITLGYIVPHVRSSTYVVIARRTSCSPDSSCSWPLRAMLFNLFWFWGGFPTHHSCYEISSKILKWEA